MIATTLGQGRRGVDLEATHVTYALTSEGADASEDGTGRGTPLVVRSDLLGERAADDEIADGIVIRSNLNGSENCVSDLVRGPSLAVGDLNVEMDEHGAGHGSSYGTVTPATLPPSGADRGRRDGDTFLRSAAPELAAPLTKGSATGEGVNQPGRRQEDDVNIVTTITLASDPISAENLAQPSTRRNGDPGVVAGVDVGVRRLTPTECERLQGFPDGWTQLGDTADSKRYSALGDAVTVNVAEWIGSRLAA